jgi:hypothetical protein
MASPPPQVFGAQYHGFVLHPPLPEPQLTAFESQYRVKLPTDYRRFLSEVGNGGAGPHFGLFGLGERTDLRNPVHWEENDGEVGVLSKPFPHAGPWNDLTGEPNEDDDHYDQKLKTFYERYFSPQYMNGAVPLAALGDALAHWLVITGPEAGHVWADYRSDYRGIMPLSIGQLERVTFLQWYSAWLEEALAKLASGGVARAEDLKISKKKWWQFWQ